MWPYYCQQACAWSNHSNSPKGPIWSGLHLPMSLYTIRICPVMNYCLMSRQNFVSSGKILFFTESVGLSIKNWNFTVKTKRQDGDIVSKTCRFCRWPFSSVAHVLCHTAISEGSVGHNDVSLSVIVTSCHCCWKLRESWTSRNLEIQPNVSTISSFASFMVQTTTTEKDVATKPPNFCSF